MGIESLSYHGFHIPNKALAYHVTSALNTMHMRYIRRQRRKTAGFKYIPLHRPDSIRLLLLHPSSECEAPLTASLHHISLAEHYGDISEGYTALSYVWGNPEPSVKIALLDNDQYEFGITEHLGAALRDIRHPVNILRLWVDAICIDQANIPERNSQVSLMGEIYANAISTIIYLGTPDPDSDFIFRCVEDRQLQALLGPTPSLDKSISSPSEDEKLHEQLLKALENGLLCRPWFRRVWVLQEVVRSRSPWVQCGRSRVRWTDLRDIFMLKAGAQKDIYDSDLGKMDVLRSSFYDRPHDPDTRPKSLWELIALRKACIASDPRDMVYAQMGILKNQPRVLQQIRVNYAASIAEVFASACRHGLEINQYLFSITDLISRSALRAFLPSWVADWNMGTVWDGLSHFNTATLIAGQSGRDVLNTVLLQGITKRFDVVYVSEVLPRPDRYPATFKHQVLRMEELNTDSFWENSEPSKTTRELWGIFLSYLSEEDCAEFSRELKDEVEFWVSNNSSRKFSPMPCPQLFLEARRYIMYGYFTDFSIARAAEQTYESVPMGYDGSRLARLENGIVVLVPAETTVGDTALCLHNFYVRTHQTLDMQACFNLGGQPLFIVRPQERHPGPALDLDISKHLENLGQGIAYQDDRLSRAPRFLSESPENWNLVTYHCKIIGRCVGNRGVGTSFYDMETAVEESPSSIESAGKRRKIYTVNLAALH